MAGHLVLTLVGTFVPLIGFADEPPQLAFGDPCSRTDQT